MVRLLLFSVCNAVTVKKNEPSYMPYAQFVDVPFLIANV